MLFTRNSIRSSFMIRVFLLQGRHLIQRFTRRLIPTTQHRWYSSKISALEVLRRDSRFMAELLYISYRVKLSKYIFFKYSTVLSLYGKNTVEQSDRWVWVRPVRKYETVFLFFCFFVFFWSVAHMTILRKRKTIPPLITQVTLMDTIFCVRYKFIDLVLESLSRLIALMSMGQNSQI